MRKLNLGSGAFPKKGYVNVDISPGMSPDVIHDLNEFPYPFPDDSFGLVEADHILEHLEKPFEVMKEIRRVAKPGATVIIRVPHFSRGFTHCDHRRGFDVSFSLYFDPAFRPGYQGFSLELVGMRLRWFAQPRMKEGAMGRWHVRAGAAAGKALDFLASLSPRLCSRLWCHWVGGFEEIEFVFRVGK